MRARVGDRLVVGGDRIGEVAFSAGGRLVRVSPLVAAEDVGTERTGLEQFVDWIGHAFGRFLGAAIL